MQVIEKGALLAGKTLPPKLDWYFERKDPRRQSNDKKIDTGLSVDISGMIRESTQNSNDAKLETSIPKPAQFSYRVLLLSGKPKDDFIAAGQLAGFSKRIQAASENPHLNHSNKGLKTRLRQASRRLHELEGTVLPVLVITDEGTKGLSGDDLDEDSSFYTFTHTVGRSQDKGDGKGGSHGVGKGLLWELSAFRTIFLATVDAKNPQLGTRLYGVCNNVEHTIGGDAFTGPGYFGLPDEVSKGQHAYSLKDADRSYLDALFLSQPAPSGLSICIPGLIPDEDLADSLWQKITSKELESGGKRVAQQICEELVNSFWPALAWKRFEAKVSCELVGSTRKIIFEQTVDSKAVSDRNDLRQLSMAFGKAPATVPENDPRTGFSSYVVNATVPAEKDGSKEVEPKIAAKAVLVLTKVDDLESRSIQTIRGTGMVISRKYALFSDFTSEPGWAGILLAGKAVFQHRTLAGEVDEQNAKAFDQFLTLCEGATHIAWSPEQAAVAVYTRMHTDASLKAMRREVGETLRAVLQEPEEQTTERPTWFNLFRVVGAIPPGPKKFYMQPSGRVNQGDTIEIQAKFDLGKQKSQRKLRLRAQLLTEKGPVSIRLPSISALGGPVDLADIPPASGIIEMRLCFNNLDVNPSRAGIRVWLERERDEENA